MTPEDLRTWIEISEGAVKHNIAQIRSILAPKTALWAVVKSNAYGHGIFSIPRLFDKHGVDGFCVDTLIEGVRLRESGIKKPILVLGLTLPNLYELAVKNDIQITISNFDILKLYLTSKDKPKFHIKLDTGMHRQGFYLSELPKVIKNLSLLTFHLKPSLVGLYTHFSSAKDTNYLSYTDKQFSEYEKAVDLLGKIDVAAIDAARRG
jgi:alanine racemase